MTPRHRWAEAVAAYLESLTRQGYAPAVVAERRRHLRRFEAAMRRRGVRTPEALAPRPLETFRQALPTLTSATGRPYRLATRRTITAAVRGFLRWGVQQQRWPADILRAWRRRALSRAAGQPPDRWTAWQTDYGAWMRGRGLSPATLRVATQWLPVFARSCRDVGVVDPAAVTRAHLERFSEALATGRRYALSTQRMALEAARRLLRWAVRTGRLLLDPTLDFRLPRAPPSRIPVLTETTVAALMSPAADETPLQVRNRTLLEVLYGTGIRHGEAWALDLTDVDLRDGWLRVRRGKGGTGRRLPLGPHLVQVLKQYLTSARPALVQRLGEPALFLSQQGRRLSRASLDVALRNAGRRVGLDRLSAHDLRRACATHLVAAGAPLEAVQQQMGHQRLDTTDLYVRLPPASVATEHARTHPRSHLRLPPQTHPTTFS